MTTLNKTIVTFVQWIGTALLTGALVGAFFGSAYSIFKWVAE